MTHPPHWRPDQNASKADWREFAERQGIELDWDNVVKGAIIAAVEQHPTARPVEAVAPVADPAPDPVPSEDPPKPVKKAAAKKAAKKAGGRSAKKDSGD